MEKNKYDKRKRENKDEKLIDIVNAEIDAVEKFGEQSDYRSPDHYRDYFTSRSEACEAKTIFEVLQCTYKKDKNKNNCEKNIVHVKDF